MNQDATSENGWFFIIGCQRSGTTLMRLILECHSQIQCCDELTAYRILAGRLSLERTRPLVGFKVPRLTEQFADPMFRRIGGTSVPNPYRQQRLVFMVRDVRDTVASMLHLRVDGVPWIEQCGIREFKIRFRTDNRFSAEYRSLFDSAESARHPALAKASLYWRYKTDALLRYMACAYPLLLVRYEDLVSRPEVELLRVCGFLGVPWEPALLSHPRFKHTELFDNGLAIGNTDPEREIDERSVGQWRRAFKTAELEDILEFAGERQTALYQDSIASVA